MLPSEMIILLAIVVDRKTGARLRNRSMDVTGEYIGYLYDSLVIRGYLKQRSGKGYQLTQMGRLALLDFIRNTKTRSSELATRLKLLGCTDNPGAEAEDKRTGKRGSQDQVKIISI